MRARSLRAGSTLLAILAVPALAAGLQSLSAAQQADPAEDTVGVEAAFSKTSSQSSPIALSGNGKVLVAVNPDSNSVSVFAVKQNRLTFRRAVAVDAEPVSVVVNAAGSHAYVACARANTVNDVNLGSLRRQKGTATGAEPRGVALSPSGRLLYVANAGSNTVSVLKTGALSVQTNIDVSPFGTSPRALAVTNDKDKSDTDETIYVAMFFGQLRPGKTSADEGQDDQREGHVVAISASTNTPASSGNPISLGPLLDTGFNSNGQLAPASGQVPFAPSTNPQTFVTQTGAFPNQLASIALHPTQPRAYVVSTGASPNGPLRFNQMAQGLVSVFDRSTGAEITAVNADSSVRRDAPLNLNRGVNLATTPSPRWFYTNPVAMAWRPNGADAWVAVQNSDTVLRVTVDSNGIPTIGAPLTSGPSNIVRVDLQNVPSNDILGKAPRGIVINSAGTHAYVHNYVSRSITTIDITNGTSPFPFQTIRSSPLPSSGSMDELVHAGRELFFTGRGPNNRMSSEGWGSCGTCHPDGRSDNVTWMFAAGPRQTVPLDGMFSKTNPSDQRVLNWSAIFDENQDFELNTRGVFGGRGLIDDDRLFLAIGGSSSGSDTLSIDQFHQSTGTVGTTNDLTNTTLPTLPGGRRDFGIATLDDDRVFIIGGRSGTGPGSLVTGANSVLEFNPRTNSLIARNSTGFTPRHSLGAAAVKTSAGFRIYALGGYDSVSPSALPVAGVEEYNPTTDTWRTVASLPVPASQFGICVSGGLNTAEPRQLIHVVMGNGGTDASPSIHPITQRFQADPTGSGVWSEFFLNGLTPRRNHGAATVLRGVGSRVFIIGGQNQAGTVLSSVEEYLAQSPSAVLTPHTDLPSPRARFGIGRSLSTNQIYVVGGIDGSGVEQTSVLEYTPATNGSIPGPTGTPSGTWTTRANLSSARSGLQLCTPPGVTSFLPAKSGGRSLGQEALNAFVALGIRSARAPVAAGDDAAVRGRTAFNQTGLVISGSSCASCHGGAKWTRSVVDYAAPPSPDTGLGLGNERVIGAELRQTATQPNVLFNVGTFTLSGRLNEIRANAADISQAINPLGANGFNIPSLFSVNETAPYYYSGLAQTLDEVLDGSQDTASGGTRHHFVSSPSTRADLIAFLRSIDSTTPVFPLRRRR